MLTTKELGLEPSLKEEAPTCSICCEDLTLKNIVNPECGHSTCKDCFWRWAKDKNTCPFCRTNLLKNDKEAQDIQQMRQLLEHRTRIVRQVEDAYDEEENLKQKANRMKIALGNMKGVYEDAKSLVKIEKTKLEELKRINGGAYQTLKHLQGHQKELDEFNRKIYDGRIGEVALRNVREMVKKQYDSQASVLKDIKILGRSCPGPWEYGWFCKPKLDKVREMNKVRKERTEQRRIRDSANRCYSCCSLGLRELFSEDEDETDMDFGSVFEIFQHLADVSDNVVISPNNYRHIEGRREIEHRAQYIYQTPPPRSHSRGFRTQTIDITNPPPLRRRRHREYALHGDNTYLVRVGETIQRFGGIPPGNNTDDDIPELE